MSEYCQQCSIYYFGEDYKEFTNMMDDDQYAESVGAGALCEGCGSTVVNIDGKCIYDGCEIHAGHGEYP